MSMKRILKRQRIQEMNNYTGGGTQAKPSGGKHLAHRLAASLAVMALLTFGMGNMVQAEDATPTFTLSGGSYTSDKEFSLPDVTDSNSTKYNKVGYMVDIIPTGEVTGLYSKMTSIYVPENNPDKAYLISFSHDNGEYQIKSTMSLTKSSLSQSHGGREQAWVADNYSNEYSVAIGSNTIASGNIVNGQDFGEPATEGRGNAVAIGHEASAFGPYSLAIGSEVTAENYTTIALGRNTHATGFFAMAQGENANATGTYSMAIGSNSVSSGAYATAEGTNAKASGTAATAVGMQSNAAGQYSAAYGLNAAATGNYTTAAGFNAAASGSGATAIGNGSSASGTNSAAFGGSAVAQGDYSAALGAGSIADTKDTVSVGTGKHSFTNKKGEELPYPHYRRIVNVEKGTSASDAATVAQTATLEAGDSSITIDTKTNENGSKKYIIKAMGGSGGGSSGGSATTGGKDGTFIKGKDSVADNLGKLDETASTGLTDVVKLDDNNNLVRQTVSPDGKTPLSTDFLTSLYVNRGSDAGQILMDKEGLHVGTGDTQVSDHGFYAGFASPDVPHTWENAQVGLDKEHGLKVDGKVYIDQDGINANSKKITHVAAGSAPDDAVNMSQLKQETGNLSNRIDRTNEEVDKVGAMSMAIAGLHPLAYNEGEARFQISAALGTYDGQQAAALGGFYYFNRDSMLSFGMASDTDDFEKFGANIGYTRRIGPGGSRSLLAEKDDTIAELSEQVRKQKNEISQQNQKLAEQDKQIKAQESRIEKLEQMMGYYTQKVNVNK